MTIAAGLVHDLAGWLDGERRDRLLPTLEAGSGSGRSALAVALIIATGGGLYGAACGLWRDPRFVLYTTIKLPLVLFVTAALSTPFSAVAAATLGLRLRFAHVVALAFHGLATTALLLGSFAPVAALFTLTAPDPASGARTTHNLLYLMHVGFVGYAGLRGTLALEDALARLCRSPELARRIGFAWVVCFALVGGEVAWALRPFIGSIYQPVAFLRRDALDGNVYEFIATDILPHLLGSAPGPRQKETP
jgi:hypothetical protein